MLGRLVVRILFVRPGLFAQDRSCVDLPPLTVGSDRVESVQPVLSTGRIVGRSSKVHDPRVASLESFQDKCSRVFLNEHSAVQQSLIDVLVSHPPGRREESHDEICLPSAPCRLEPFGNPTVYERRNVVRTVEASALDQGWQGVVEVEPSRFGAAEG